MIKLTKYDFIYHADVKVGQADPEVLHRQQTRTVRFLVDKFIADLENPSKILVFRQNEPLSAHDLIDLRMALTDYGPSILLWVQEARPGHPPGTVVVADDTLMLGYVSRLATRRNVPDLDLPSWLTCAAQGLCDASYRRRDAVWSGAQGSAAGASGNAIP